MTGFCEGRTAIVTGAGNGLGKSYALLLAAEGAHVVVNDINAEKAQRTVDEITAAGGKAICDLSDITDYEAAGGIVASAISTFGDLHCVINNAGNNRDRMFASMTVDEWDDVMRVHLKGHFCISSHAVHHWRDKSKAGQDPDGRIINTSSGAGLQGSVGQTNYAAAKAGILALTLNQSAELGRYGITANAVAPQGRTGMTEKVFAEMMAPPADGGFDQYNPDNVAPLVVYLASAHSRHLTGHCFESFGGKLSIAEGWKTGPIKDKGDRYQVTEIAGIVNDLLSITTPSQKVYGT